MLDECHDTGVRLIKGKVIDAAAILASDYYFGPLLRDRGISVAELCRFLQGNQDLLPFAKRLRLSLRETLGVLNDIKKADGQWCGKDAKNRWWRSHLLEFKILVPKRGPALGKERPAAWRDYAGAKKYAAISVANERARRQGRRKPTIDDWFGWWSELPSTKGWEVVIGETVRNKEAFESYCEAFMEEHEKRKGYDNYSYQLLLSDYIGVDDNEQPVEGRGCLRSVLLGYLKTEETVLDGDCGSCSVCRPDERFETDLSWRSERVVRFSEALADCFKALEALIDCPPPAEALDAFWLLVDESESNDQPVGGYLRGWSNRLISETPGHVTAWWLRVDAMLRPAGSLPLDENDLLAAFQRLLERLDDQEALERLADRIERAIPEVEQAARFDALLAKVMHRLLRHEQEQAAWERVLRRLGPQSSGPLALDACRRLAGLFSPRGPLADPQRHRDVLAEALMRAPARGVEIAEPYLVRWPFSDLLTLLAAKKTPPAVFERLLTLWFQRSKERPRGLASLEAVLADLDGRRALARRKVFKGALTPFLLKALRAVKPRREERERLTSLLRQLSAVIDENRTEWLHLAAELFEAAAESKAARDYWVRLLQRPEGDGPDRRNAVMTESAYQHLIALHSVDAPLADVETHRKWVVAAATAMPQRAEAITSALVSQCSLETLCALLQSQPEALCHQLLGRWFQGSECREEFGLLLTVLETVIERYPALRSPLLIHALACLKNPYPALVRAESRVEPERVIALFSRWIDADWLQAALQRIVLQLLVRVQRADAAVNGRLTAQVDGGYRVAIGGVEAFLPGSAATGLSANAVQQKRTLSLRIVELKTPPEPVTVAWVDSITTKTAAPEPQPCRSFWATIAAWLRR